MTQTELKKRICDFLKDKGIGNSDFEAQVLVKSALSLPYDTRLSEEAVSGEVERRVFSLARQRSHGQPLQYLAGVWEFYGHEFFVGPGVLIPRSDTETLCDEVIALCKGREAVTVIDLCSGSGCIAVALSRHLREAEIYGVELSEEALRYFEKNARQGGSGVHIVKGDVLDPHVANSLPIADIIASNPPYIPAGELAGLQREVQWEPRMALDGGEDGLHFYRGISALWKQRLKPGGTLLFEVGDSQSAQVTDILWEQGYSEIRCIKDLSGFHRIVAGMR